MKWEKHSKKFWIAKPCEGVHVIARGYGAPITRGGVLPYFVAEISWFPPGQGVRSVYAMHPYSRHETRHFKRIADAARGAERLWSSMCAMVEHANREVKP